MEAAQAFGKILREMRLEAGLTQEQLGLEAGVRRTFVSVLELGEQQPTLTTIVKLSRALSASPSELVKRVEVLLQDASL